MASVGFVVMFTAQGDHSFDIVVLALAPRRIEMMPCKKWLPTTGDRTTESYFLAKLAAHFRRRSSARFDLHFGYLMCGLRFSLSGCSISKIEA